MIDSSTLFQLITPTLAAASTRSGERTEPGGIAEHRSRPGKEHSGEMVVGRLGFGDHEGIGVAPQLAARTLRIRAVIGCGDVQRARGAVG
jgi:hypothetical protein